MKKIVVLLFLLVINHSNFAQQHNVIFVIADDIGADYCGFYSNYTLYDPILDTIAMPNVRRLLKRGVRFKNAWSNPVCSPTRAGMLTGRYSFRTGVGNAIGAGTLSVLNTNEITIPKLLDVYSPNGISKALIGKWHLQLPSVTNYNNPNIMGFNHYEGSLSGGISDYFNWQKIKNGVASTNTNYATTEVVNNSISWITAQPTTQPFFLWMAFNAPHSPFHLPPAGLYSDTTLSGTAADISANPKKYYKAMVQAMDHELGRLFDYLQSSGKWTNTDIVFIGDNGADPAINQGSGSAKGSVYQKGISVPFIISGPTVVNPNRSSDALVSTVDLFATALELFGFSNWQSQIPSNKPVDSKSLIPILLNTATAVRPWAFTEVFKDTPTSGDGKAMRNTEYKLIKFDDGTEKFFNLMTNPIETINQNLLLGTLNTVQTANYTSLCNEMTTLVGSTNYCNPIFLNNESFEANENRVYPNPFQSTIRLKSYSGNEKYELYSNFGQLIYSGSMIEKQDFSALSKGVYFLRIKDKSTATVKLVKE